MVKEPPGPFLPRREKEENRDSENANQRHAECGRNSFFEVVTSSFKLKISEKKFFPFFELEKNGFAEVSRKLDTNPRIIWAVIM